MTNATRAAVRAAGLMSLVLAAACATVPPIDRYLLETEPTPVELKGAHGVLSHAQSAKILADLKARSPDTAIFDRHVAIEQTLAGTPLSVGNRATLLEDGPATYAAMLAAIRAARSSIHLEMYIFEGSEIGQEFGDALAARCKAGVKVRVIYDSVGSIDTPKEFFEGLKRSGVEVAEYNPVSPAGVLEKGIALDHRDHRKLVVVDGRVAFLGGINISKVYGPLKRGPAGSTPSGGGASASTSGGTGGSAAGAAKGAPQEGTLADRPPLDRPWRDTMVKLEGPVVAELQHAFLAQWAKVRKETPLTDPALFPHLAEVGHDVVRAMPGSPDDGIDPAYVALISAIESAETRVRITNAYFVPARELVEALERAARRGVDVQMILPSLSDNWIVLQAGHVHYEDLLEAGVKIYEREHRLLHAKTATVDGVWSTVGSTNLDWRSLQHNDELNAVVLGPEFAASMDAVFDKDRTHSTAITRESWAQRPLADRLKERAARCWSLFL
jgi:cardiolipin synthase